MPRPKRPKVIHTIPLLRDEKQNTTSAQPHLRSTSPASSGRVTTATDDSDGLVTTQKLPAGARRTKSREQYIMTGALEVEELEETRLRPPSKRLVEEANRIAREAQYASLAADKRRAREIEAMDSSNAIQIQPAVLSRGSSKPESLMGPSATQSRRPSIISRSQQTPMTHSSTLGTALFKKRPRQPSLLQMVQSQNEQIRVQDDEDEDLDDFRPDDESTPLVKPHNPLPGLGSLSSRQTSGSRKRKLTALEVQLPGSQSDTSPSSSPSAVLSQPRTQEDATEPEEVRSPEPTLPRHPPSQTSAPEIFSDTLAPPQSSGSPPPVRSQRTTTHNTLIKPPTSSRAIKQSQTRTTAPTRPQYITKSTNLLPAREPLRPLPTAALQNLLPRRKTRQRPPRGAFDFPGSSEVEFDTSLLGEHEDELSFHSSSKLRRKPSTKTSARSMQQSTKKSTAKVKGRTKETPIVITGKGGKRVSKTYNRKSLAESDAGGGSDEEDEDDSLGPASLKKHVNGKGDVEFDAKAKREMERLARKFAEVDEYALDFEDMTGSSSQMADAR